MRVPLRAIRGVLAALIVVAGAAPSGALAALSYDVTLGAGAQWNDNLYLDPRASGAVDRRAPVEETIFTIDPGATVSWLGERDRLQLDYRGEYWMFSGDEDRDPLWMHNLVADLNWRRWSPFFLEAREERDRVPRSLETEGESVVEQVARNRLSGRTGLAWELGSRGLAELAYRGELQTFSGIEDADRVLRQYGEGLLRYRWSPLWGSEMRLAYGHVDRTLAADYAEMSASAAVDQRLSEHLALRYRIEWLRTAEDAFAAVGETEGSEATVRNNLLKTAEISGELALGGSWRLGYQDALEYLSDGDTRKAGRASADLTFRFRLGSTVGIGARFENLKYRVSDRKDEVWGPTLRLRWVLAPWSAFDLGGSWTSVEIKEAGLEPVKDRTSRAAAGVVLLMFKRIQLEAGYGYARNSSTGDLRSYTNNLAYVLATFHFQPILTGALPPTQANRW